MNPGKLQDSVYPWSVGRWVVAYPYPYESWEPSGLSISVVGGEGAWWRIRIRMNPGKLQDSVYPWLVGRGDSISKSPL